MCVGHQIFEQCGIRAVRQNVVFSLKLTGSVGLDGARSRGHDELNLKSRQVAGKCGMLPLALNMAGRLGSEDPLNPTCWRRVLDRLRDKDNISMEDKFSENGGRFFAIVHLTFSMLPPRLRKQFMSMAVVAPGVSVSKKMMANLWDTVRLRLYPFP